MTVFVRKRRNAKTQQKSHPAKDATANAARLEHPGFTGCRHRAKGEVMLVFNRCSPEILQARPKLCERHISKEVQICIQGHGGRKQSGNIDKEWKHRKAV